MNTSRSYSKADSRTTRKKKIEASGQSGEITEYGLGLRVSEAKYLLSVLTAQYGQDHLFGVSVASACQVGEAYLAVTLNPKP